MDAIPITLNVRNSLIHMTIAHVLKVELMW